MPCGFSSASPHYFDDYAVFIRPLLIERKRLPDTYGREELTKIDMRERVDIIVGKMGS